MVAMSFLLKDLHAKRLVAPGFCSRMNSFNLGYTLVLRLSESTTIATFFL